MVAGSQCLSVSPWMVLQVGALSLHKTCSQGLKGLWERKEGFVVTVSPVELPADQKTGMFPCFGFQKGEMG